MEPDEDIQQALDAFGRAFEEFKATNDARLKELEAKGAVDPVVEDKLRKVEEGLAAGEALSRKLLAQEEELKGLRGTVDELEKRANRPATGDDADRAAERKRRVNLWTRGVVSAFTVGIPNLPEDQRKALDVAAAEYKGMTAGDDTTGGYLAPRDYVREIIREVTEASRPRALARVRSTAMKAIAQPKRTGQFSARRVGETEPRTETEGLGFGMVEITAPEAYALIDISQQNLEDTEFDFEAEIREEAVEQFGILEGREFVSGSGVGEMEGILSNGQVGATKSGHVSQITADGLLTLKYDVKTAYARSAKFVMNRRSLGAIRRLKDKNDQYLWMPGIQFGRPNTIDGDPYEEVPDMPDEAANAKPVAYGDFRRAYTMADRVQMSMLRDPYTQATNGMIRFHMRRRVGGRVVLPEAIRTLVCKT